MNRHQLYDHCPSAERLPEAYACARLATIGQVIEELRLGRPEWFGQVPEPLVDEQPEEPLLATA